MKINFKNSILHISQDEYGLRAIVSMNRGFSGQTRLPVEVEDLVRARFKAFPLPRDGYLTFQLQDGAHFFFAPYTNPLEDLSKVEIDRSVVRISSLASICRDLLQRAKGKSTLLITLLEQPDNRESEIFVRDFSLALALSSLENEDSDPLRVDVVIPSYLQISNFSQEALEEVVFASRIVRHYTDLSPTDCNTTSFIDMAVRTAQETGFSIQVIEKEELENLGLRGILSVGGEGTGERRCALLRLSWRGREGEEYCFGLLGKGILFDTGGAYVKPGERMKGMHADMSGAAVALAAVASLARSKSDVNVVAYIPLAWNLLGPEMTLPGRITTICNGMSFVNTHTDAEGRIILADAAGFMSLRERIERGIIAISTLTGDNSFSYSSHFLCNDRNMSDAIIEAGRAFGESYLRLPASYRLWESNNCYRNLPMNSTVSEVTWENPRTRYNTEGHVFIHRALRFLGNYAEIPFLSMDIGSPSTNDSGERFNFFPSRRGKSTGHFAMPLVSFLRNFGRQ